MTIEDVGTQFIVPDTMDAHEALNITSDTSTEAAPVEGGTDSNDSSESTSRNTLRYIILGLLWAHPMSGYDIKQAFDRALASYWNAGNSQIYTLLKNLSQAGLVESEVVVQTTRPNRKVYRLTATGQVELERWLEEEIPERFTKDDFLTRLFFCGETSDEVALRHLQEHRESLLKQLAHMEWARQQYATRPTRRPRLLEYQMLVREYKEAVLKAGLEVTERAIGRLEKSTTTPASYTPPVSVDRREHNSPLNG